jgi:NAD(P)-dependent dehydrogenase (short-subunit alcohol dehydrogenase family)
VSPKIILITGCTSGIGRESALLLARQGHRVFATGRSLEALAELREQANLETLVLDVTQPDSIQACLGDIDRLTAGDGIDVLINNAGYAVTGPLECVSPESLQAGFEVNVFGLMRLTQLVIPRMRQRRSGRIINISSIVGRITFPLEGAYVATKHAVEALSDALRLELAPFGIDIVIIQPGAIRSEFARRGDREFTKLQGDVGAYQTVIRGFQTQRQKLFQSAPDGSVVAQTIAEAVNRHRPKIRYVVPLKAQFFLAVFTWLPDFATDAIKRTVFSLPRR